MTSHQVLEEAAHFEEFAKNTDEPEMRLHWYKQALARIMLVVSAGEMPPEDLVAQIDTYKRHIESIDSFSEPSMSPQSPESRHSVDGDLDPEGGRVSNPSVPIFGRLKHSIKQIANRQDQITAV